MLSTISAKIVSALPFFKSKSKPTSSTVRQNLNRNHRHNPVSIATTSGGTAVVMGLVDRSGEIHHRKEENWRSFDVNNGSNNPADWLVQGIADRIWKAFQEAEAENRQVGRIGLSLKGPLERVGGELQVTWLLSGPFNRYPILARLVEELANRRPPGYSVSVMPGREGFARHIQIAANGTALEVVVEVRHDGSAAILGEVSIGGTFSGELNAIAIIIGTGIGLGVVLNGVLYEGNLSDAERHFGSLGRHLVYVPDGSAIGYHYEYRGIAPDKKEADINSRIGERHLSKRLSGPLLAQHLAKEVLHQSRLTLWDMGLSDVERSRLGQFSMRTDPNQDKDLEKRILSGLTQAALRQNPWAHEKIAEIGIEIGRALGEFIFTFRERAFVKKIVLVSTVAENLGKGVAGHSSNDLLLDYIREGIERTLDDHLHYDDLMDDEKERLTNIIRNYVIKRSETPDRELLAFAPLSSTQP